MHALATDITTWEYAARIVVESAVVCVLAFVWWRDGSLPTLVGCIVFLAVCQIFVDGFHLYTRSQKILDHESYRTILTSMWWPIRLIPELLVWAFVFIHVAAIAICPERFRGR